MKLEIKDIYTVAGNDCNEDAVGCGENYLFVLDGATDLSNSHITNEKSDARWFSHRLKAELSKQLDKHSNVAIQNMLYNIIEELRHEYKELAYNKDLDLPPDYPSSGIALFRIIGDELEFYGLGDCVGVLIKKNGEAISSCGEDLPALDAKSIQKMVDVSKAKHIDVFDARKDAFDIIMENRMKRNTSEGYWILDLSNKGTENGRNFKVKLDEVESIFVASDGYTQLVSPFNEYEDNIELADETMHSSIEDMIKRLFYLQEQDPKGNNFPRLKFRDDTSAGVAKIVD